MYKIDDKTFTEIVRNSFSLTSVIKQCNLVPAGGNFYTVKNRIEKLRIDTSHFTGQNWAKGKVIGPKKPIEEYLKANRPTTSHNLKLRLLKEGIFEHKCTKCHLREWNNEPIPLELEHINGDHIDNRIENLTLLCPNCHAQTPTYRGRKLRKALKESKDQALCSDCRKTISSGSKRCKSCAGKLKSPTKISWPCSEELRKIVKEFSYTEIGRRLGVSDNAVRKRLKRY